MLTLSNLSEHVEEIRRNRECVIYKPIGMTPLELVNECIRICGFEKGSFSGRLDPMAHGASMIVFDDKCKRSVDYHSLGKTYIFKFIVGIKTTSLDLLGFPTIDKYFSIKLDKLRHYLEGIKEKGGYNQKLPDFCSFRVVNKDGLKQPLWWWAVNNRMNEIYVPSFERKLFNFEIINGGDDNMSLRQISNIAINRIKKIKAPGNFFNIFEIINSWSDFTENDSLFQIYTIKVDVSSGFFIRSLVRDIGETFGVSTITFDIERLCYF